MKGQFFISGIVVIAVILIVSMSYANSAEELRNDLGNDLAFDNYKNAYERAVPDDWEFTDYENRNKIGICLTSTVEFNKLNTTVQFTSSDGISSCNHLKAESGVTIYVNDEDVPCWLLIRPAGFVSLVNSQKCTEFYVYQGDSGSINVSGFILGEAENGTKFSQESIETGPETHLLLTYREKNIFVDELETMNVDGNYKVTYRSDIIDYTGEL